jgi:hypothetical protein
MLMPRCCYRRWAAAQQPGLMQQLLLMTPYVAPAPSCLTAAACCLRSAATHQLLTSQACAAAAAAGIPAQHAVHVTASLCCDSHHRRLQVLQQPSLLRVQRSVSCCCGQLNQLCWSACCYRLRLAHCGCF